MYDKVVVYVHQVKALYIAYVNKVNKLYIVLEYTYTMVKHEWQSIPSKAIQHLDEKYGCYRIMCWAESDGFHVELILQQKKPSS